MGSRGTSRRDAVALAIRADRFVASFLATTDRRAIASSPVFAAQSVDAVEFAAVAGDDDEPPAARVAGDQNVIGADGLPRSLERRPNVGGVRSGGENLKL